MHTWCRILCPRTIHRPTRGLACWLWRHRIKFSLKGKQIGIDFYSGPESSLKLCQPARKTISRIIRKTEHVENYDPPCRWHATTPAASSSRYFFFFRAIPLYAEIFLRVAVQRISHDSRSCLSRANAWQCKMNNERTPTDFIRSAKLSAL